MSRNYSAISTIYSVEKKKEEERERGEEIAVSLKGDLPKIYCSEIYLKILNNAFLLLFA